MAAATLLASCEVDEKKADFVKTGIGYDDTYGSPNAYYYSALDNEVQVTFFISGGTDATVTLTDASGKVAKTEKITADANGMIVAKYPIALLGIAAPSADVDDSWPESDKSASVKVEANGVEKVVPLKLVSPFYSITSYRAGSAKSTVSFSKVPAIAVKSIADTVNFAASASGWSSLASATWGLQYKVNNGSWVTVANPVVVTGNASIMFITKFSDISVPVSGGKIYYRASVTNGGETSIYPGEYYARTVSPLSAAITSTNSVSKFFNPALNQANNDTVVFKSIVPAGYNRAWLKLGAASWNLSYKIGSSASATAVAIDPSKITVNTVNDTLVILKYIDVLGSLPGLNQYDTLAITSKLNVATSAVSQTFKTVVPKFKK